MRPHADLYTRARTVHPLWTLHLVMFSLGLIYVPLIARLRNRFPSVIHVHVPNLSKFVRSFVRSLSLSLSPILPICVPRFYQHRGRCCCFLHHRLLDFWMLCRLTLSLSSDPFVWKSGPHRACVTAARRVCTRTHAFDDTLPDRS